jgi:hypothetical protein
MYVNVSLLQSEVTKALREVQCRLTLDERIWAVFMHTSFRYESGNYMTNTTFPRALWAQYEKTALVNNAVNAPQMQARFDDTARLQCLSGALQIESRTVPLADVTSVWQDTDYTQRIVFTR